MRLPEIFALAFALAADAFTVGAAIAVTHRKPRQIARLSFHFGLFQFLMPLVGALLGTLMRGFIDPWGQFVAFGLLLFIGAKMVAESFGDGRDEVVSRMDPTKGWSLVGLSFAVSIDALAAGFTLVVERAPVVLSVSIIGVVAASMTLVGMLLAGPVSTWLGKRCELIAGLVLIVLGTKAVLIDM
ncbi:MAG: manganese efflux pump MntP family protein [Myxococcota bacterium]|jgi:putative Mn2+ efflux pump MntP|nr:manganese efflux pump MntP family protein [Myxococcota bacterium]